jgi:hypothetical protein
VRHFLVFFTPTNDQSASQSDIERSMHFPIEFVAPFPSGNPHRIEEKLVANVDATLKPMVDSHRAYGQIVPDCFNRSGYRRHGP